jgi:hypothetical protein
VFSSKFTDFQEDKEIRISHNYLTIGTDSITVQLQIKSELGTSDSVKDAFSAVNSHSFFKNLPESLKEFGTIYIYKRVFSDTNFLKLNFG